MTNYWLAPVLELLQKHDPQGEWKDSVGYGIDLFSDVRQAFVYTKEKPGPITPAEIERWCDQAIAGDVPDGGPLYGSFVLYRETGSSAWLAAWFIPVGLFEGRLLVITSLETWLKHLQEKQDG